MFNYGSNNPYNAFSNNSLYNNPVSTGYGFGYSQPTKQEITEVYGVQGAQAYQMAPNSSVIMLDANNPVAYIKKTDGAGSASIMAYKLVPYESDNTSELEKRVRKLEDIINESYIVNAAELKRKSAESDNVNQEHAQRK